VGRLDGKVAVVTVAEGVVADSWTVDDVERAVASFTRTHDAQGEWRATLAGPVVIPASG